MHELGLAQEIIARVVERARAEGAARVSEVTLRIGRLSLVVPDSLSFYFTLCAQGTLAEGARLSIEGCAGQARCGICREVFEFAAPLALCPRGHAGLQWLSGFELDVVRMRIEDAEERACAGSVDAMRRQ